MSQPRRDFLASATAATVAGLSTAGVVSQATGAEPEPRIKKAVKFGMVAGQASILDKFKLLKQLGFDGVEMDSPSEIDVDEVLRARDATGLEIPGVVNSRHWRDTLSHPDSAVRARGVEAMKTALQDARRYGATTVLLVPAVVNKEVRYDQAYQRSQTEIRKLLPVAEDLEVKIALENVWNQFLLSPMETAQYIDAFESPMIGAYFDIGNVVNYGWPEHWIQILNHRILKLDIKEFSRKRRNDEGLFKGFQVKLTEGDCDWPAVMKALVEIDYRGWGTAEVPGGDATRLEEIAQRMDQCFAS
jgi:hexulose-6-phosphate isomerase